MNRSVGITISAVIAILGSVVVFLFAALMLATLFTSAAGKNPTAASPASLSIAAVIGISAFYAAWGVWGITSAIGVLRLRNWARISFLVYSALLTFVSTALALGAGAMAIFFPTTLPNGQMIPPTVKTVVLLVLLIFATILAAIGIGWLIFFNRQVIKLQFSASAEPADQPTMPMGITIVAWIMGLGILALPFALMSKVPAFFFGILIWGWPARLGMFVWVLISAGSGIGMLLKQQAAHRTAVFVQAFGLVNFVSWIIFGSREKVATLLSTMPSEPVGPEFTYAAMRFGMAFGIAFSIVILWILLSRREAFGETCQLAASPQR